MRKGRRVSPPPPPELPPDCGGGVCASQSNAGAHKTNGERLVAEPLPTFVRPASARRGDVGPPSRGGPKGSGAKSFGWQLKTETLAV